MAQVVVHEDDGQHRLRYGRRPQSDTRIMTSGGHHLYGISGDVDRVARYLDTRCRFEGCVRDDVLSRRDSPEHSPGIVALESRGCQLVAMLTALLRYRSRAGANLHSLDGVDAHERVRNVGIKMRGLSTRSPIKPGLRVDFNRYIAKQKFLGLHSLILDNALRDPSMIRERTSMAFIAHLGQPASREAFGKLYLNGEYQGVYAFVEAIDKEYLSRTLGENDGYLLNHKYLNGFHAEYLGDDLSEYKTRFEAQTHQLDADTIIYTPVRELFRQVNHPVDGAWRSRVSEYLDLDQFVTYLAIENFLSEDDGFLGYAGMANFYMYRRAD